jgi:hypothetical protein
MERMCTMFKITESREAMALLDLISQTVKEGCDGRLLQRTPHVVLLDRPYYRNTLKPLLAKWMLLWLRTKHMTGVEDAVALQYLEKGPRTLDAATLEAVQDSVKDDQMRLLNLSQEWLSSLGPFLLSKINRVGYGLLSVDDIQRAYDSGLRMPKSRKLLAVPFMGKDVPTRASEFSHPDVVMGLSILAFRHEGLRRADFMEVMKNLKEQMRTEQGPCIKRKSCKQFARWVELAGGR